MDAIDPIERLNTTSKNSFNIVQELPDPTLPETLSTGQPTETRQPKEPTAARHSTAITDKRAHSPPAYQATRSPSEELLTPTPDTRMDTHSRQNDLSQQVQAQKMETPTETLKQAVRTARRQLRQQFNRRLEEIGRLDGEGHYERAYGHWHIAEDDERMEYILFDLRMKALERNPRSALSGWGQVIDRSHSPEPDLRANVMICTTTDPDEHREGPDITIASRRESDVTRRSQETEDDRDLPRQTR